MQQNHQLSGLRADAPVFVPKADQWWTAHEIVSGDIGTCEGQLDRLFSALGHQLVENSSSDSDRVLTKAQTNRLARKQAKQEAINRILTVAKRMAQIADRASTKCSFLETENLELREKLIGVGITKAPGGKADTLEGRLDILRPHVARVMDAGHPLPHDEILSRNLAAHVPRQAIAIDSMQRARNVRFKRARRPLQ